MIFLKIVGGILLIAGGVFIFWNERKEKNKESTASYLVAKSISFQGYIFAISLLMIGFWLIISCF